VSSINPLVAFATVTGATAGANGQFQVSVSSVASGSAIAIFDKDATTGWASAANYIDNTGSNKGKFNPTITGLPYSIILQPDNIQTVYGDWIEIRLPSKINIDHYSFTPDKNNLNQSPRTWFLLGSNDGTNFYEVDYRTNSSATELVIWRTYSLKGSTYYYKRNYFNTYRLVVTNIIGSAASSDSVKLQEFAIYGWQNTAAPTTPPTRKPTRLPTHFPTVPALQFSDEGSVTIGVLVGVLGSGAIFTAILFFIYITKGSVAAAYKRVEIAEV
jgi:hypothetical protein